MSNLIIHKIREKRIFNEVDFCWRCCRFTWKRDGSRVPAKNKKIYKPQVTILNGENAASGRGITEKIYKGFLQDGVDVVTMGNHTWDNREIFEFIDDAKK